ncbi:MAG: relaxase/mobilization nuclease domain-containing protein [Firmicutes bacterium]|nr:relaxase/mobilization nuclease domain-containing protein [Bacillota bacterium]
MALFKQINETYRTEKDLKNLIYYITLKANYWDTYGLPKFPQDVILAQFMYYKRYYYKTEGNQALHFCLSFDTAKYESWINAGKVRDIIHVVLWMFEGFQVVYGIHLEPTHYHVHFCVNTISYVDGKRFRCNTVWMENQIAYWLKTEGIAVEGVNYIDESGRFRKYNKLNEPAYLYLNQPIKL